MFAISFVCLIYIMTKNETPEYKLPWILVCLILPGFGVIIYIMFSSIKVKKKDREALIYLNRKYSDYIKPNFSLLNVKNNNEFFAQMNFISNFTGFPITYNNKIEYFKSGEEFKQPYLNDLKNAKKYIFLEYFIIANDKFFNEVLDILKQKVKEGVEVKLIYDDFGSMFYVPSDYYKTLNSYGIKTELFNKVRPILSSSFNNRDHRKITIIDGKIAYTGGLNLADEYVNYKKRFGIWKDNALRIQGPIIKSFLVLFLSTFNADKKNIEKEFTSYLDFAPDYFKNEKGYSICYCDGPNPIYVNKVAKNTYLNAINYSKNSIYISSPYLILDNELSNSLINASKRGVNVNIVIPGIPDKKLIYQISLENVSRLIKSGINIYKFTKGFNHSKMILVDDVIAIVGTINFDYRSLVHNFENAVFMYKTSCIKDIKSDFMELILDSKLLLASDLKKNIVVKSFVDIIEIFSPLF